MATRPEQLYEDDFYAWTREQARALRRLAESRPNVGLDLEHLIEEVEDLGTSQRDAVRSHLRTIIEHCLKLERSRATPIVWPISCATTGIPPIATASPTTAERRNRGDAAGAAACALALP